ncbi:hypothetical protein L4D00_17600 [Photobacterium swingsii]|uniref:hypothetical protein n=1 Tax=Photobacterium swingsii TaxID=680026 RepID=UPI003D0BF86A
MNLALSSSSLTLAVKSFIFFALGIASYELINHYISPTAPFTSQCQLTSTPCQVNEASLSLEKDLVNPMVSNTLSVNWDAIPKDIDRLQLSLEGHEMMMGTYRLILTRNKNQQFSGDLLLPVCTEDAMTWFGTVAPIDADVPIDPLHISVRMIK